jgi:cytochrome P450
MMTFSFGPHSCIGTKFSIAEIKVFVATLVQHFVFEPEEPIKKFSAVLTRPYVADQFSMGSKLPLRVRRYVG